MNTLPKKYRGRGDHSQGKGNERVQEYAERVQEDAERVQACAHPPSRQPLLVWMVVMMVMVMMVTVMDDHHNLRLCRIRCGKAEDQGECEQNSFHT
jgi:hypothetical protein